MNNSYYATKTSLLLTWLFLICLVITSTAAWSSSNNLNQNANNSSNRVTQKQNKLKSSSQGSKSCKASHSVSKIGHVVSQIKNGNPPSKPVKIPAARLVQFNPVVLHKLGDHYVVLNKKCQIIPVVNGKLAQKATVDFSPLANALANAVQSGNKKRVSFLVNSFRAERIKPMAGLSLVTVAPYNKSLQNKIAKSLDLTLRQIEPHSGSNGKNNNHNPKRLLMSDLYVRLGGHLTKPFTVKMQSHKQIGVYFKQSNETKYFNLANLRSETELGSVLRSIGYQTTG